MYCIFILTHMARGLPPQDAISILNTDNDLESNDVLVYTYVKERYGSILSGVDIIEYPFILNQIAKAMEQ